MSDYRKDQHSALQLVDVGQAGVDGGGTGGEGASQDVVRISIGSETVSEPSPTRMTQRPSGTAN